MPPPIGAAYLPRRRFPVTGGAAPMAREANMCDAASTSTGAVINIINGSPSRSHSTRFSEFRVAISAHCNFETSSKPSEIEGGSETRGSLNLEVSKTRVEVVCFRTSKRGHLRSSKPGFEPRRMNVSGPLPSLQRIQRRLFACTFQTLLRLLDLNRS